MPYDEAIQSTLDRLKNQEDHHDKMVEALKSQIASLRQQTELNKNLHSKEM
eukprot:CAMPEP_0201285826 /NCGR_PEP_ID=MMETSP1317-20130820/113877_1 /ASSEMBLY_ACC=CAM_ASM_000770 /TAXON_ID=187299 /ORGANISM="Undescribed Undescribed, Strain Undescribed" /LENGTH=50 /DNA_ID=CAMNT_0047611843 /DNA_START=62 /DNA_END=214 /DNA_ORIENTATION=-